MTEAWKIKPRIVSKGATLWKWPYCSMRIYFIRFLKGGTKKKRTGGQGRVLYSKTTNLTIAALLMRWY